MARSDDHARYELILESTRDSDGLVHKDEAVKLFKELLAEETDRIDELAEARANEVARNFDKAHQPDVENGQMSLFEDSYLVLGKSERVKAVLAKAAHTRRWIDGLNINKARQDQSHAAKTLRGYRLLEVQEEHACSIWEAQQILNGGAA